MRAVNLIPYDVVVQREVMKRLKLWLGVAVGVCLLVFSLFMVQSIIVSSIELKVKDLESRAKLLKVRHNEYQKLKRRQAELADKARVVQTLLSKRDFIGLFIALEKSMGPSVRLNYLMVEKKQIKPGKNEKQWENTGYFVVRKPESRNEKIPETLVIVPNLIIRGVSLTHDDLAEFIRALEKTPLFDNVKLGYCRIKPTKKDILEFEINATITT